MHYVDEGAGDPVVCFHGEPTWAYLYRKMLPPLVERRAAGRVPGPTPGFGRSDKPTDRGWYTYDRHVEYVAGAARRRSTCATRPSSCRTGAGRSGCAGRSRTPSASRALVILNTGLFTGRVSQGLHGLARLRRAQPRPAGRLRASRARRPRSCPTRSSPPTRRRSRRPSRRPARPSSRCSCRSRTTQPGATEMRAVTDALSRWDKPALVAFSDSDPVFPYPRAGRALHDLIPGAGEQVRIEGAAHFLQEDRGERIAELRPRVRARQPSVREPSAGGAEALGDLAPSRRCSTTRRCSRGACSGTSGSRRAPRRRRRAAASCRR